MIICLVNLFIYDCYKYTPDVETVKPGQFLLPAKGWMFGTGAPGAPQTLKIHM